jgi:hypothetical protein
MARLASGFAACPPDQDLADRHWVRAAVSSIQDAFRQFDPRSFDRVRLALANG